MDKILEKIITGIVLIVMVLIISFSISFESKRVKISQCIQEVGYVQTCRCAFTYCDKSEIGMIIMSSISEQQSEMIKFLQWRLEDKNN